MGRRGPGAKPTTARPKAPQRASRRPQSGLSRAERVIAWCEGLKITSGAHAGRKLRLRPWQRDIIRSIYAVDAAGRRPVRTALVSFARKNGKSALAAALALCHLIGPEAIPRGQVVSSAADRNQAALIYAEMKAFALANATIAKRLVFRDFKKEIEDVVTGSTFASLSSDAKKAHGLSPNFAVADELAQWRDRSLLDAIRTGQGAHSEPLCLIISTRSPDPDSPLEELLRYAEDVRSGVIEDPSFVGFVWTAPLDADPWADKTWHLANPGLGDFRDLEDVKTQAAQARRLPSQESSFRAYILNQPVTPDERFIGPALWDACSRLAPAEGSCFAGLDLSSGPADLTAFALYWPKTGRLVTQAFLPAAQFEVKSREDRAPYASWEAMGHVVRMPGRAIDKAWLGGWIKRAIEGLELSALALDRWGLNDFEVQLDREGIRLPLEPHGMGFRDMSPALSAFEAAVLEGEIAHGGNPLLRWALANAAVDTDPAGGRKLSKARAKGRIDPLMAAILAVAQAARQPAELDWSRTGLLIGEI
jgi:phage terminase large subunit-like protein